MNKKTRVPVYVPLPPFVIDALNALHRLYPGRPYYSWTGAGKLETAVKSWKRTLARLFEIAGVNGGHAHRFRDTFAVEFLLRGVPLEDVSQLLSHTSTRVTENSYAPWVKARQEKLEMRVRATWPEEPPANVLPYEDKRKQAGKANLTGETKHLKAGLLPGFLRAQAIKIGVLAERQSILGSECVPISRFSIAWCVSHDTATGYGLVLWSETRRFGQVHSRRPKRDRR